jgi:hypothetical protein
MNMSNLKWIGICKSKFILMQIKLWSALENKPLFEDKKPASKSNVIKVETRVTRHKVPRKYLSMTEDSPCQKQIRLEVKEAK